jgi:hypothetical protein
LRWVRRRRCDVSITVIAHHIPEAHAFKPQAAAVGWPNDLTINYVNRIAIRAQLSGNHRRVRNLTGHADLQLDAAVSPPNHRLSHGDPIGVP